MMIKVAAYEDQHRGELQAFWKNPKNFRDHDIPAARRCFAALARSRGRRVPTGDSPQRHKVTKPRQKMKSKTGNK
jgi:hypothetical protein